MLTKTDLSKKGNRSWKVIVPPIIEPISINEVKLFCRIDTDDEDSLITDLIIGVRENAEAYLGRALLSQTIRLVMDYWPDDEVELPQPPLLSITSIETIDEDDSTTTYSSDNYYVVTESTPGKIIIKNGASPPTNTSRYTTGYRVTYVAGYGTVATDIPQSIREGLKVWVSFAYENRVFSVNPPPEVKSILNSYRIIML